MKYRSSPTISSKLSVVRWLAIPSIGTAVAPLAAARFSPLSRSLLANTQKCSKVIAPKRWECAASSVCRAAKADLFI